ALKRHGAAAIDPRLVLDLIDVDLRPADRELVRLQFGEIAGSDDDLVAVRLLGQFERVAADVEAFFTGLFGCLLHVDLAFGAQLLQFVLAAVEPKDVGLDEMGAEVNRPGRFIRLSGRGRLGYGDGTRRWRACRSPAFGSSYLTHRGQTGSGSRIL